MYAQAPAPPALAARFSTLSTWTHEGGPWRETLAADPCFEIAWVATAGVLHGPAVLTPASRSPGLQAYDGGPLRVRVLRLRPASVGPLIGADAPNLVDAGWASLRDLGARWRAAAGARTEGELCAALAALPMGDEDPVARLSVARLREPRPVPFPALAGETGYSYAQWRRRMRAATGVSPKFLDRFLRLQRASRLARARPAMGMAEVAFRTGYASDCALAAESSALAGRTFRSLVAGFTLPE